MCLFYIFKNLKNSKVKKVTIEDVESVVFEKTGIPIFNGKNGNLKDLELLVADELKALSTSGVFITGNNVKLLFKYDSNTIVSALEERGVNRC